VQKKRWKRTRQKPEALIAETEQRKSAEELRERRRAEKIAYGIDK
jgi:hypothetical protein